MSSENKSRANNNRCLDEDTIESILKGNTVVYKPYARGLLIAAYRYAWLLTANVGQSISIDNNGY